MSDEEFDEEFLRAAALKSMGAKKTTVPETQKFTPLPRPDFDPRMHQRPIPSTVPHLNYGQMNFVPNNFHNQYNFRQNYSDYNYNNGYMSNLPPMNIVPPVNQFRHHHTRPFNYPIRPGGFNPQHMFNNQQSQQYHHRPNYYMNQNNHAPRHNKPVPNSIPIKTGEPSQSQSTAQSNATENSNESRRLPERFSRIERSDSESDEDDRLDEFADADDDENSQESEVREIEADLEEVPNGSDEVEQTSEEGNNFVVSENVDYDDLLGEDIESNGMKPDVQSSDSDREESVTELTPKHGSDLSDDQCNGSVSPVRPPSRRVVVVARDTPEKITSPIKIDAENGSSVKPSSPVPKVAKSLGRRTIKLKVDGDIDAIERRRLKFGVVDEEMQGSSAKVNRRSVDGSRKVRIPSFEEEDRDSSSPGPSRKKLRSFVVLKK